MAYSANDHQRFSVRMQKFMMNMNALRNEANALNEIYVNETSSGADAEFVATDIATKQEHIDGILYALSFTAFNENDTVATVDRTQWMTPFLQA